MDDVFWHFIHFFCPNRFFPCAIFVYNTKNHYLCPDNMVSLKPFFIITLSAEICNTLTHRCLHYGLRK